MASFRFPKRVTWLVEMAGSVGCVRSSALMLRCVKWYLRGPTWCQEDVVRWEMRYEMSDDCKNVLIDQCLAEDVGEAHVERSDVSSWRVLWDQQFAHLLCVDQQHLVSQRILSHHSDPTPHCGIIAGSLNISIAIISDWFDLRLWLTSK